MKRSTSKYFDGSKNFHYFSVEWSLGWDLNSIVLNIHKKDRLFGESKYSFLKMLLLALDEITSFSVRPLRLAKVLGLLLSMSSIRYALCALSVIFLQTMS